MVNPWKLPEEEVDSLSNPFLDFARLTGCGSGLPLAGWGWLSWVESWGVSGKALSLQISDFSLGTLGQARLRGQEGILGAQWHKARHPGRGTCPSVTGPHVCLVSTLLDAWLSVFLSPLSVHLARGWAW